MKRVYLIALIVALIAGSATYFFASTIMKNSSIEDAPTEVVLVANSDIVAGTAVTADQVDALFTEKKVLVQDLTPNAVKSKEEILGQVVMQTIYAQEQVSMNRFMAGDSEEVGLSYTLQEGEVAYSIVAESQKGVDGYIKEGDTIDIIAYYESKTVLEFENLKVLKVSTREATNAAQSQTEGGEVMSYTSVTIKTDVNQAMEIWNMENRTGNNFKFVLHSRVDAESIE